MIITIETVPHGKQRYDTCGDWQIDPSGNITIRVSKMGDWRMEAAIAVHELVEALLCRNDDVSQEQVDHFDTGFRGEDEPGDAHDAPYARQHCFATAVERMLIAAFGLSWASYEATVEAL
jgi:hypothetical protein